MPLIFNAPNHDNLFDIVDKVKNLESFTPEMAARFAIGLKLMGEVMLENRDMVFF
ncbi:MULTISPECIES: DUF3861 family protein [Pelistega]|uniref:DUF3861 family protein n=1 Tax=Pelistega TaxID=106146 RepID=UPI000402A704|nr:MULTISPECIES: DUF3861 family protein [Pelistega]